MQGYDELWVRMEERGGKCASFRESMSWTCFEASYTHFAAIAGAAGFVGVAEVAAAAATLRSASQTLLLNEELTKRIFITVAEELRKATGSHLHCRQREQPQHRAHRHAQ
jgi:hypothetical protein